MTSRTCQAIILAAGQGTRMKSSKPKVLHAVAGLPMVGHVVKTAANAGTDLVSLVVGPDMQAVQSEAEKVHPAVNAFTQTDRLGTAHAALAAKDDLADAKDDVIILYGDTPLLRAETITRMRVELAKGFAVVVLGFRSDQPDPYGRLLEDDDGKLVAIREAKDCTEEEFKVNFCNGGIMGFAGQHVVELLTSIDNNNAQGEYYLPDAVEKAIARGLTVTAIEVDEEELQGVNNRQHLAWVESAFQERARSNAMTEGVTLIAPETVFFSHDTSLGKDVIVEPNVVFGPNVTIDDNVEIRAFSHLEGAQVASGSIVGPYARLRPGTDLRANAKVGNFVEIKKAVVEEGAKVNHLSYIGDARVGSKANIGAGTITCNYDGFNKFKTDIGAGAFIGSNSALVAPVEIGDGAIVAAGSTITRAVPSDSLVLTRAETSIRESWAARFRALKKKKN